MALARNRAFGNIGKPEVTHAISKDLKDRAEQTREDAVFTLKLDEGVSLAELVSFAQDMFPGVSTDDIGAWPADDDELVVSVRGGAGIQSN